MNDLNGIDLITRLLPALAVVILLPLGFLWLQRRRQVSRVHPIRVATRTALARNTWLAIVEVEGRRLLVATGERGVNLIAELDPVTEGSAALDEALAAHGGIEDGYGDGPRMGLVRRLQERTVRRAAIQGPNLDLGT